jgi:hypothetical protein
MAEEEMNIDYDGSPAARIRLRDAACKAEQRGLVLRVRPALPRRTEWMIALGDAFSTSVPVDRDAVLREIEEEADDEIRRLRGLGILKAPPWRILISGESLAADRKPRWWQGSRRGPG